MKIESPLLMLKEKDLLGRPIPQHLECKVIARTCWLVSSCCTAADWTQEGEDDFVYQFFFISIMYI